ncbi:hypothetical protein [Rhizobium sp. Leaf306]|nr:hypothetical protein [Rhizobium sp. Leaf306]
MMVVAKLHHLLDEAILQSVYRFDWLTQHVGKGEATFGGHHIQESV